MKSASTQRLYAYWQALRGERPAPERREIEPSAIKGLLSDVFILEHLTGQDFSYRLAGSSLCAAYCRELKNRYFRDHWKDKDREAVDTVLQAIREDAAAAVIGYNGVNARGQKTPFEMLLLPLRYGGDDFPRILGIATPQDSEYWLGLHPIEHHDILSMRLVWPDEQPSFLRQAVNADALYDADDLVENGEHEPLVDGDYNLAVRDTTLSDLRATTRRQAFRVIDGGRS